MQVAEYDADTVRDAILALPGVSGLALAERPNLHMLEWREADRSVLIEIEPFENPDWPFWAGSPIQTHCTFGDLLALWTGIALRVPNVWVHNSNCTMFSPETFVERIAEPSLRAALQSDDLQTRARAENEQQRYAALVESFHAAR